MTRTDDRRRRLTIVCDTYWPEVTSTAQLITELAEGLASDFDVEVLTAQPRVNAEPARRPVRERINGVEVRRLAATRFAKSRRLGRLANWLSFFMSLLLAVAVRLRPRTYLFLTNPPLAPWALVPARLLGHRCFVLVYDLYPDLAEAIGAVRPHSLMARGFDRANRFAFRRASGLIALGEDMRERLAVKVGAATPIRVIPNWANGELISPRPRAASAFARANGLLDRFVFLYAGNLGLFQDLETLVEAVEMLPEGPGPAPLLVFVGDGGKRHKVEALAAGSQRVLVRDYVPYEQLGDLYAAADVGLIALEPGVEKTNVPSKTYSILAAGKPFLAVSSGSRDLARLAEEGCGICVPNDPAAVAAAMEDLIADRLDGGSIGAASRAVFERDYSRDVILQRYRDLLST